MLGEIGAGGMGRVYRAHDPTLRRDVAIKVLHGDSGTWQGDLLAEARSASALNLPNICTVYALALMHTGLGNRDEAIAWLGRALDQHAWGAVLLAVEPDLDPLRSDPRFADLVARSRR